MTTSQKSAAPTEDQVAQGPPKSYRSVLDQDFAISLLMELQKSVSQLETRLDHVKESVDSTKTKVEGLTSWKNKILGGAMVLGALISIATFLIGKFSSYITIAAPASEQHLAAPPAPQAAQQQPPPTPHESQSARQVVPKTQ